LPTKWQQNDDRDCDADKLDNIWSLFCAIKIASIEKAIAEKFIAIIIINSKVDSFFVTI
jgi:hypothetical protein